MVLNRCYLDFINIINGYRQITFWYLAQPKVHTIQHIPSKIIAYNDITKNIYHFKQRAIFHAFIYVHSSFTWARRSSWAISTVWVAPWAGAASHGSRCPAPRTTGPRRRGAWGAHWGVRVRGIRGHPGPWAGAAIAVLSEADAAVGLIVDGVVALEEGHPQQNHAAHVIGATRLREGQHPRYAVLVIV